MSSSSPSGAAPTGQPPARAPKTPARTTHNGSASASKPAASTPSSPVPSSSSTGASSTGSSALAAAAPSLSSVIGNPRVRIGVLVVLCLYIVTHAVRPDHRVRNPNRYHVMKRHRDAFHRSLQHSKVGGHGDALRKHGGKALATTPEDDAPDGDGATGASSASSGADSIPEAGRPVQQVRGDAIVASHDAATNGGKKNGKGPMTAPIAKGEHSKGAGGGTGAVAAHPIFPDHYEYRKWQSTEYECVPDFFVELPVTRSAADMEHWKRLEKPFFGCEMVNTTHCKYKGDCSTYQIAYNSSVAQGSLGDCGVRGADTITVERAKTLPCDRRTFAPLKAPQGAFFGHFVDNILPKLVRVLLRGEKDVLVYMEPDYQSPDTLSVGKKLGVEITFQFPTQCFQKIVYACHTISFDPLAAQSISRFLRAAYAPATPAPPPTKPGLGAVTTTNPFQHGNAKLLANGKKLKRVYASRLKGTRNGRKMANEEEFARILKEELGFIIFEGGESPSLWADTLRDAEMVVGPHGTALSHILWLDPANRPIVLELDAFDKFAVFWVVARSLGAEYGWMAFDAGAGIDIPGAVRFIQQLLRLPIAPIHTTKAQAPLAIPFEGGAPHHQPSGGKHPQGKGDKKKPHHKAAKAAEAEVDDDQQAAEQAEGDTRKKRHRDGGEEAEGDDAAPTVHSKHKKAKKKSKDGVDGDGGGASEASNDGGDDVAPRAKKHRHPKQQEAEDAPPAQRDEGDAPAGSSASGDSGEDAPTTRKPKHAKKKKPHHKAAEEE